MVAAVGLFGDAKGLLAQGACTREVAHELRRFSQGAQRPRDLRMPGPEQSSGQRDCALEDVQGGSLVGVPLELQAVQRQGGDGVRMVRPRELAHLDSPRGVSAGGIELRAAFVQQAADRQRARRARAAVRFDQRADREAAIERRQGLLVPPAPDAGQRVGVEVVGDLTARTKRLVDPQGAGERGRALREVGRFEEDLTDQPQADALLARPGLASRSRQQRPGQGQGPWVGAAAIADQGVDEQLAGGELFGLRQAARRPDEGARRGLGLVVAARVEQAADGQHIACCRHRTHRQPDGGETDDACPSDPSQRGDQSLHDSAAPRRRRYRSASVAPFKPLALARARRASTSSAASPGPNP